MKLRITHDTRYLYEHMVDGALHQAHLRPVATPLQTTLLHALDVAPHLSTTLCIATITGLRLLAVLRGWRIPAWPPRKRTDDGL